MGKTWAKLHLRDLLWLTIVVALAMGWWVDQRQSEEKILALKAVQRQYFIDGERRSQGADAKRRQRAEERERRIADLEKLVAIYRALLDHETP